ncbi:MarR family winged helix-turn-helix transcriptional regulator [Nocardia flavorosea]|uniref:Winged helix-turn-helix transcriptional regulator n=1 Tax=Nocardia flavorosea TaxID=53429 RepID=A0A846YD67_9NOCA|nr:MarR family winged helix-turn-helix transcriptional regulator [Nocardia flavorosea]NKY57556.1 winged helix-turn-helix transcriptional regulator [Nocardia flavorosea]
MGSTDRPDLAAMLAPLTRTLIAMERPVLESYGLTMWAYSVLVALSRGPARGQGVLAQEIGADKTRIIAVLDDLQDRGLLHRYPDPADRRARLLELTAEGHRIVAQARTEIQSREEQLVLQHLSPADRQVFLSALHTLAELPRSLDEDDSAAN